ncbi:MAG: FCD domain-containing protein, partial [Desulfobacterales bacterium]
QRFSRSGTIVSPVDIHIYKQNIEIRTVLEGLAGELAAERITAEELAALAEILARVNELKEQDDENLKELMQCEFDFHNLVYVATHNPKLIDVLHELQGVSARFWHYQIFSKQELLDQFIDHSVVVDALAKGDGQAAGEALKNHVQKVLKKLSDKVLQ